jgi:hypothetical protein
MGPAAQALRQRGEGEVRPRVRGLNRPARPARADHGLDRRAATVARPLHLAARGSNPARLATVRRVMRCEPGRAREDSTATTPPPVSVWIPGCASTSQGVRDWREPAADRPLHPEARRPNLARLSRDSSSLVQPARGRREPLQRCHFNRMRPRVSMIAAMGASIATAGGRACRAGHPQCTTASVGVGGAGVGQRRGGPEARAGAALVVGCRPLPRRSPMSPMLPLPTLSVLVR